MLDSSLIAVTIKEAEQRWKQLCAEYLPVERENSIWRYSRLSQPKDPEQGWKLHLSATVLTAAAVLTKAAPLLLGLLFKAPRSLLDLRHLNAGLIYEYTQVGKFITIYPSDDQEAVRLAEKLHRLTKGMLAPAVPFDLRYKPQSSVYYRYGAFKNIAVKNSDGSHVLMLRSPEGNLVADLRDSEENCPKWTVNPFPNFRRTTKKTSTPLSDTFRIFRVITQRGKGGVYQALDFSSLPPRLCVVKEGRRNGETDWDGRDGYSRVRHEQNVIAELKNAGIAVPQTYSSFEAEGNYYLVMEDLCGETLLSLLVRKKRRLPFSRILKYGIQLTRIVAQVQDAGFVWRDLKPSNLMVTTGGVIRPFDFEGACSIRQPDPLPWSTSFFMPPEAKKYLFKPAQPAMDLFALGVIFFLLIEGRLPDVSSESVKAEINRRDCPAELRNLTEALLCFEAFRRPSAVVVERRLCDLYRKLVTEKAERERAIIDSDAFAAKAPKISALPARNRKEVRLPSCSESINARQRLVRATGAPPLFLPSRSG